MVMVKQFDEKAAAAVLNATLRFTRNNDCREALWYSWRDADGRQCVIDGFVGFCLNKPLAGLPEMPDGLEPVNLERILEDARQGAEEIPTPYAADVAALLAYDRTHKGRMRNMYAFGAGLPVVNAAYLRDMLKVFPDGRFYTKGVICPIIIKSAYGEGVLLPIRIDDRWHKRREVIYNLSTFADRYGAGSF